MEQFFQQMRKMNKRKEDVTSELVSPDQGLGFCVTQRVLDLFGPRITAYSINAMSGELLTITITRELTADEVRTIFVISEDE